MSSVQMSGGYPALTVPPGADVSNSQHRIYTLRKVPVAPMTEPWAKVLELTSFALGGQQSTITDRQVADKMAEFLFYSLYSLWRNGDGNTLRPSCDPRVISSAGLTLSNSSATDAGIGSMGRISTQGRFTLYRRNQPWNTAVAPAEGSGSTEGEPDELDFPSNTLSYSSDSRDALAEPLHGMGATDTFVNTFIPPGAG